MILCCGEALIDMLPRTVAGNQQGFLPCPGGAVFNTAIALGRLGAPAGLFCGLSDDLFGKLLSDALDASHVASDLAIRSARPTTLAFVRLLDGQASYAFYDQNTAARLIRPDDLPIIPPNVRAMFFGGISLVSEPCGSAYEALMTREAGARLTMIDPNIRTAFITDEPAYRARLKRMIGLADIVKLSDEDLCWLDGDGAIGDQARAMISNGARLVFITVGARGAYAFTDRHEVFVAAQSVQVVDTVGAGDTFNAGVLAALERSGSLHKGRLADLDEDTLSAALTLGVRAATITVSRAGANPPWQADLA